MFLIYSPVDGDEHRWDLADTAHTLRVSEAETLERVAEIPYSALAEAVLDGEIRALRAMAWILLKRAQPSLRYSDFDPLVSELATELSDDERRRMLTNLERERQDMSDGERDLLEQMWAEIGGRPAPEEEADPKEDGDAAGTSPSPSSA